jgi:hypothetical protein
MTWVQPPFMALSISSIYLILFCRVEQFLSIRQIKAFLLRLSPGFPVVPKYFKYEYLIPTPHICTDYIIVMVEKALPMSQVVCCGLFCTLRDCEFITRHSSLITCLLFTLSLIFPNHANTFSFK